MRRALLLLFLSCAAACEDEPAPSLNDGGSGGNDAVIAIDGSTPDSGVLDPDGNVIPPADTGVLDPDGNVIPPEDSGVLDPDGNVIPPEDTGVVDPDGNVIPPDTGVLDPDGNVIPPEDTGVIDPDGNVTPPDTGVITADTGVLDPDGNLILPDSGPPPGTDTDSDGLPDIVEDPNRNGVVDSGESDPNDPDSDDDGLLDGQEDRNANGLIDPGETSPVFADSDLDGISDGVEDADRDGVVDATETNPTVPDTDRDGLPDGCEDTNFNGAVDPGEANPIDADSDDDQLSDGDEDVNRNCARDANETSAGSSDTDCDLISDFDELRAIYAGNLRTDPLRQDSDNDGIRDGVETGRIAVVPNSVCGAFLIDRDPATRTNPTNADSDGDTRIDGCEDANDNGRVDAGEMNPLDPDSDGDGLLDQAEDTNNNCVADGTETNAANADTDGDGIGDATEIRNGTNPRNADSDGDLIPDGIEDANQNGTVDPGETNPRNRDTDGDGIFDGTEDTNRNGRVDAGETDPRDADTDNDGLTDGNERTRGTNPLDNDSDNDGLSDGDEVTIGSNPLDNDTDNDGILDGDEVIAGTDPLDATDPGPQGGSGINAVCSAANLRPVQFANYPNANWMIALETTYVYGTATITVGNDRAAHFRDNAVGVNGYVMNIVPPVAGTDPIAQAQAIIARITGGAAVLGTTVINVVNNGRQIISHDGFGAVVDIRVELRTAAATDIAVMRNRVMAVVSNHTLAQFVGLPLASGITATDHVVRFEVLVRGGRVYTIGGLTTLPFFNNTARVNRHQLEDLSNGTALARAYSGNATGCDPFTATQTPSADFIWLADISGSTNNDRGTIATAAGAIFTGLANNGVDFRMGVVPHSENRIRDPGTPGQLRSGFTRTQATFINDLNNTTGGDGCEYGLTAVDDAIVRALPRTAVGGAEVATRIRGGAQLVVFYISDEHAQEIEDNLGCPVRPNPATGQPDDARAVPNATQQARIQTIVDPFLSRIRGENGVAFGQLTPLQAPFCAGDLEDGRGYFEVVTQMGGTFYRTCDANPGSVLQDIIDSVSGSTSQFVLTDTPISLTIRVGLTRQGSTLTTIVPRSSVNGFDYDAAANTVFFRGATFRPNLGDSVTISYRIFTPPVPPVVCPPPLVRNPTTNTCECPATCGIGGGCGAGFICDRNPNVCACICEPDCGGTCGGLTVCSASTCSCNCAPNCGGACTGNFACDSMACGCVCRDTTPGDGQPDCNGTCSANQVCDATSCTCACPADCGGACGLGQTCDVSSCTCVGEPF